MSAVREMLLKARATLLGRGVIAQDAEEIVHDAFIRVAEYENKQRVRSREAMLIRTAVNISIDRARRDIRSPFAAGANLDHAIDWRPQPDEVADAKEKLRHLNDGLQRLPEKSRRILLARRIDDVSVSAIASREGMSIAAVEKQIARATLTLMNWMDGW